MYTLNEKTAKDAVQSGRATKASYDRRKVKTGVVHFGVGNFHRCHQAVYFDNLIAQGDFNWGIVGVSLRSNKIRNLLAPQDYLYTQVTLSKGVSNENTELKIIGAIKKILVAPENPLAVIEQVSNSSVQLVTTTITEKGYYLSSGEIDAQNPDIIADGMSLNSPKTIYGYLAAAIILRYKKNGTALSVLSCDNIQNGGRHLLSGVQYLLNIHDKDCLAWSIKNISFGSSMVDRVSPATDDSLKQLVHSKLNLGDAWPVSSEPFSQWIIEDTLCGKKPRLDMVGALFTGNISLYEQMKLRLLNASHSIISVLAYLDNRASVHQALEQSYIEDFTLKTLHTNILPAVDMPDGIKGEDYIADVMQRFHNSSLPYAAQQVNTDSSQKIQQRWFPSIDAALVSNSDVSLMSFILAAWVLYVQYALDANELNDPLTDSFLSVQKTRENFSDNEIITRFLSIASADRFKLFHSDVFMPAVFKHYQAIKNEGLENSVKELLSNRALQYSLTNPLNEEKNHA